MFGHLPEFILVLIAALVIFGPKRIPQIGGSLARTLVEFRRGKRDVDSPDDSRKSQDGPV